MRTSAPSIVLADILLERRVHIRRIAQQCQIPTSPKATHSVEKQISQKRVLPPRKRLDGGGSCSTRLKRVQEKSQDQRVADQETKVAVAVTLMKEHYLRTTEGISTGQIEELHRGTRVERRPGKGKEKNGVFEFHVTAHRSDSGNLSVPCARNALHRRAHCSDHPADTFAIRRSLSASSRHSI